MSSCSDADKSKATAGDNKPAISPTIEPKAIADRRRYVDACSQYFNLERAAGEEMRRAFVGLQTGDVESMKELRTLFEKARSSSNVARMFYEAAETVPPGFERTDAAIRASSAAWKELIDEYLAYWEDADDRHIQRAERKISGAVKAFKNAEKIALDASITTASALSKSKP